MNLTVVVLVALFLILLTGIAWVTVRTYSLRLSRIDNELRSITEMLSETPKETSLKDYMFAQDQRLCSIGEKLDSHPDTDVLQQYIQDQANQIIAVISTHDDSSKSITKADLEITLQVTNDLLERVLWSLRFDEDKYADRTEANKSISNNQGNKNISKSNAHSEIRQEITDKVSMKNILENCDDGYDAMLKYMQQSGKSGVEAQQALKSAKTMHGNS